MKRYSQLISIIEKSLSKSSACIDTRSAVQECYGDNISMFASGAGAGADGSAHYSNDNDNDNDNDNNSSDRNDEDDGIEMLSNLIQNILENINETFMQNDLQKILSEQNTEFKLNLLDQVIHDFLLNARVKEEEERLDIQSARDAVENTELFLSSSSSSSITTNNSLNSLNMKMNDLILYQSCQLKLKLQKELVAELEKVEKEKENLLHKIEVEKQCIQEVFNGVENDIVNQLNKNADICSFNGMS